MEGAGNTLNIAICDDEVPFTGELESMLAKMASHKSYAIEACDVQPLKFLVKPLDPHVLGLCFKLAVERVLGGNFYFRFEYKRDAYSVWRSY